MKTRQLGKIKPACRERAMRVMPALSRLSLLIGLGLASGMATGGASYTDSVTFSTTNQSLWGNSSVADISKSNFLGVSWGTFTGGAASPAFSIGSITDVYEPVFNTYLGSYGLKASMSSSAKIGLDFSTALRGGTIDYSQSVNPLLTLDTIKVNTVFSVSAKDTLKEAAVIKTTAPNVSTYLAATLDFQANLQATGCAVSCSSMNESFGFKTGTMNLISWNPSTTPQGRLGDGDFSQTFSSSAGRIVIGGVADVGSYKFADTLTAGNCSSTGSFAHCAANLLSGDLNLTAMLAATGRFPFYKDISYGGIHLQAKIVDVALKPDYALNLDVAVTAPVFAQLEFDKPITEILADGTELRHSDKKVSFALGSTVNLRFDPNEVGTLIKRSYYLNQASFNTSVSATAKLDLDSKVGCGVSLSAFGYNVIPDTSNDCAFRNTSNLADNSSQLYGADNRLNSVRTTGVYQGLGSFNDLSVGGVYGAGQLIQNTGSGSVARISAGDTATVNGNNALFNNAQHAKTFVSGRLSIEQRAALNNSAGAELVIEAGGVFKNSYVVDDDFNPNSYGRISNRNATGSTDSVPLITNRGSIEIGGQFVNGGVINNWGSVTLLQGGNLVQGGVMAYGGSLVGQEGVFNNQAGGTLTVGLFSFGEASAGTVNLLAGSTLNVAASSSVRYGYKQVNAGTINVTAGGRLWNYGELQIGDGGTSGSLTGSIVNFDTLSFLRSDDNSFAGVIDGGGTLRKLGQNTLTLTANNTYTGITAIDGGRLVLPGNNASSEFRIAANAVLDLGAPGGVDRDMAANTRFSGAGSLLKTGAGQLRWGQSGASFAMDAGGMIDVQGGSLVGGSSGNEDWSLNKGGLKVAAGAFFEGVEANVRVDAISGAGTIKSGYNGAGYSAFTMGVVNGSGVFSGTLGNGGAAGNFTKVGAGLQVLTGANTFTGRLTVNGGELRIGDGGTTGSLATVLVTNNSELSFFRSDNISFAGVIDGTGNLTKMGAGQLALSGNNSYGGITSVQQGTLVLTGTSRSRLFDIGARTALEVQVAQGTRDGTADVQFVGAGQLVKSGAGTTIWSGAKARFALDKGAWIDVQGGTLVGGSFGNEDWSANQSSLTVATGALFHGVEANVRVDALGGSGRIQSGYKGAGYNSFTFGVADGSGTFYGVLADSNTAEGHIGNFTKVGSGTQTLVGNNTFTGVLSIEAGTLRIGEGGSGSLATGSIVNNGALVFSRGNMSYQGVISGSGSLNKPIGGTLLLSGANTYTGKTSVDAGVLLLQGSTRSAEFAVRTGAVLDLAVASGARVNAADTVFSGSGTLRKTGAGKATWEQSKATFALGSGSLIDVQGGTLVGGSYANEDWTANKSRLNVAAGAVFDSDEANVRVDALTGAGIIKSGYNGSGYVAFTMGVGNGSGEFSGVLANSEFTGNFVKVGTGTQTLSGINTYTGTTSVQAGELRLNGSSLSSAFSVDAGATLGGSGALGSLVLAGRLAPGNSPGSLSVAGNATFAEGASYLWEIADLAYDQLSVGGTLSLNASAANPFTVTLKSLLANGSAGLAAGFDARQDHSYTLAFASGGILGFSAEEFSIDGSGFANPLMGGHWSVAASGNALNLNFTAAVPEPGTYAMLLAGLLLVGRVARRRLGEVARR